MFFNTHRAPILVPTLLVHGAILQVIKIRVLVRRRLARAGSRAVSVGNESEQSVVVKHLVKDLLDLRVALDIKRISEEVLKRGHRYLSAHGGDSVKQLVRTALFLAAEICVISSLKHRFLGACKLVFGYTEHSRKYGLSIVKVRIRSRSDRIDHSNDGAESLCRCCCRDKLAVIVEHGVCNLIHHQRISAHCKKRVNVKVSRKRSTVLVDKIVVDLSCKCLAHLAFVSLCRRLYSFPLL